VRQLDAIAARLVANLAGHTRCCPAGQIAYLDVDDTVRAMYGYAKQGAGYGYTGVKGVTALLATLSTPASAPVIVGSALTDGLVACNSAQVDPDRFEPLGVFLSAHDQILAGAEGHTHWRWIHVNRVWVGDTVRQHGAGRQVMSRLEEAARRRGCQVAWLDTFSFQTDHVGVSTSSRPESIRPPFQQRAPSLQADLSVRRRTGLRDSQPGAGLTLGWHPGVAASRVAEAQDAPT
jgi:hypothetical protein